MFFDTSKLLEQTMNSKITELMYNQMIAASTRKGTADPLSTSRAFSGRMKLDSRVAVQGAQNMEDAATMVSQAQTGVTAIKSKLDEMKKIAIEASTRDNLSTSDFETMQGNLQKLATELVDIAGSTSFNGMQLLNGSAGMNSDGVIQLQAGNSSLKQVLVNMVDDGVTTGVMDTNGKINLRNLEGEMTVTDKGTAEDALKVINDLYDRVYGIESQYSYDIKSLTNMSTLLKGQADILNSAAKNHQGGEAKQSPESYLLDLLGGASGGIFSSRG